MIVEMSKKGELIDISATELPVNLPWAHLPAEDHDGPKESPGYEEAVRHTTNIGPPTGKKTLKEALPGATESAAEGKVLPALPGDVLYSSHSLADGPDFDPEDKDHMKPARRCT